MKTTQDASLPQEQPESPATPAQRLEALVREVTADAERRSETYVADTVVPEGGE